jgi:hypothetical protein
MEFVCYAGWDQLPQGADHLLARAEKESVFFSRPWFENLAGNVSEDDQTVLLACVLEAGNVLAILPLVQGDSQDCHALKHLYTSLYTLLVDDTRQEEILTCLVKGLRTLPVRSLNLDPVAENDRTLNGLQKALEASGFSCHRSFRFYNWIHRSQGQSFADYMAERPARVRNTVARKKRKLEREHGYRVRLFTADSLHRAIADYHAVHKASWKANELFEEFVNGLVVRFSEPGWLRLAILYIEERPAAAQLWFVAHGKASIFKLAYDEAWKHYSPGSILIAYLMEYVLDTEKVEEIDFLTGNDAYKRDWMSERRERWRLCCGATHRAMSPGAQLMRSFGGLHKSLKQKLSFPQLRRSLRWN